ncbi:MAG: hypothetical protein BM557_03930 [Flavobacterium sp. MedPE-SWcel]|uniref:DUF7619 domain-containing protein n=1 Tax=uncultured Flavobacterium sp. TaxID=165435 RepID=UPI00091F6B3B|nr:T9SS type A sorting domain-containing protein [uncultured Flavobacterium sp.]OIQ21410.1 MAG: hypothetical protein BM557_03930 [Flavobacterium sp. MedPE-SWcel]
MKKEILLFMLLLSGIAGAQIVDIPDANLKNILLSATNTNGVAKDSNNYAMTIDINNDNEIQVSEAAAVWGLTISSLGINSLQGIEEFINLRNLNCGGNPLTVLDASALVNLETLDCSGCAITELDLSTSPNLTSFVVDDCTALTNVNIKGGTTITTPADVHISNTPNLTFMCVDEGEAEVLAPYLTTLYMSTYCSFTPGGEYNTITGRLTYDLDNDGCDVADDSRSFIKIKVDDGATQNTVFTNNLGEYIFYTQAGDFDIMPLFEDNYFIANPASASVNFPTVDNSVVTEDFCVTANGEHPDVEVVMVPVIPARPGQNAVYKVVYKNKGNTVLSGSVSCEWSNDVLEYVYMTPMADIIGADIYTWNFVDLQPFENREIMMTLNVNDVTDTPAINVDDIIPFTADATIVGVDDNLNDNNFVLDQKVVETYNPNNIICIQGDITPEDNIGDYLHYAVNFENTGTSLVDFVVIKHDINPASFDINTLQLLNSSHEVSARVVEDIVEFVFENANLSAADHGNILFKVKSRSYLMVNDMVSNSARIYFNYDEPLQTNDAVTTFAILSSDVFEIDNSVKLYPNPSSDIITIEANTSLKSVQLYDVQGRLLQTNVVNEVSSEINISDRLPGLYFVKITTEEGSKIEKVIKE